MKTKILWTILSCLMVVALVLASCRAPAEVGEKEIIKGEVVEKEVVVEEEEVVTEEEVVAPTGPQYGGTISTDWGQEPTTFDPWWGSGVPTAAAASLVLETLGIVDEVKRDELDHVSGYYPPHLAKGHLAESYEEPDPLTIIFHIRQGVHWHNKPPMNGRELTAYDIEYSWHRVLGLGDFAEAGPSPFAIHAAAPIESITATDKWTVVVKLSSPSLGALHVLLYDDMTACFICPPEVIEQYGDIKDWRNLVGTGPYELTEWVGGSSVTYTKNPDYWCYDEKYPENRLPYADKIKVLMIPELSTRLAALRSGKLDIPYRLTSLNIDQAESLWKTNPELSWQRVLASCSLDCYAMNVTEPPFDDIRVRRAMQLALDNETIARTFHSGFADPTPYSVLGKGCVGYYTPFEEWPEDVKKWYRYDPEEAKRLLAEAGYPNGFDTNLEVPTGIQDIDHAVLNAAYWAEIGVNVEVQPVDMGTFYAHVATHTYGGLTFGQLAGDWNPASLLRVLGHSSSAYKFHCGSDPEYDILVEAVEAATTLEEQMRLAREADLYFAAQNWVTWGPREEKFVFYQPWLKGYTPIMGMGGPLTNTHLSRCWIDQELKEEMGR